MTQTRGAWAEDLACSHLTSQGLTLIERNYSCRHGEIDLIMRNAKTIIFVEVRYRKSDRFGGALASIDRKKRNRVIATAQYYLQKKKLRDAARFDVVAIDASHTPEWIPAAFDAANF